MTDLSKALTEFFDAPTTVAFPEVLSLPMFPDRCFGAHCATCRDRDGGREWRVGLTAAFHLPGDSIDFECPHGVPWGGPDPEDVEMQYMLISMGMNSSPVPDSGAGTVPCGCAGALRPEKPPTV